jgi:hypothetical protein
MREKLHGREGRAPAPTAPLVTAPMSAALHRGYMSAVSGFVQNENKMRSETR